MFKSNIQMCQKNHLRYYWKGQQVYPMIMWDNGLKVWRTNQSFEVINKSSRFTIPSSNSFFSARPIYNDHKLDQNFTFESISSQLWLKFKKHTFHTQLWNKLSTCFPTKKTKKKLFHVLKTMEKEKLQQLIEKNESSCFYV